MAPARIHPNTYSEGTHTHSMTYAIFLINIMLFLMQIILSTTLVIVLIQNFVGQLNLYTYLMYVWLLCFSM